jgi:APA family basic amino acid/polyamine antiporter
MSIQTDGELPRRITLLDATLLNVGSMIGSGIFIVPAAVALHLHSPAEIMTAWIVGGIVSMCGALSFAELGAMMPHAGGQYVYLKRTYGPLWGFLSGWASFTVIMTASIAAVAVGFAQYLGAVLHLSAWGIKLTAVGSIVLLTVINAAGTELGIRVQNFLTFIKMGALCAVIFFGMTFAQDAPLNTASSSAFSLPSFGLAMMAVLWAYDGWVDLSFVAGEIKDPGRTIPRSLFLSTAIVTVLYLAVNAALLSVLSIDAMGTSAQVVSDAALVMFGGIGVTAVALAIAVSMLGANNAFVFTAPRIYYAMARERLFFSPMALLHATKRTPVVALIAQAVWACVLVFLGTFDQLITYIVFSIWIFYAMSCAAVIILRYREPDAVRPYSTWGYPFTPVLFILFSLGLVINTVIEDPQSSLIGLVLIFSGIPAYWYWNNNIGKRDNQ